MVLNIMVDYLVALYQLNYCDRAFFWTRVVSARPGKQKVRPSH